MYGLSANARTSMTTTAGAAGALLAAVLFASLCPFTVGIVRGETADLDQLVRGWVMENIRFEKDVNDRETLFVRRQPVRAYIRTDDPEVMGDARRAIANFANAFGLEHEFTDSEVNLVFITANGISEDDGSPSRALLRSLNVPENAVAAIADSGRWTQGCGIYQFRASDGSLSISIAAGDNALGQAKLKSCAITAIVNGFGLRITSGGPVIHSDDYLQYLLLARATVRCDKTAAANSYNLASGREDLIECIFRVVRAKLSD